MFYIFLAGTAILLKIKTSLILINIASAKRAIIHTCTGIVTWRRQYIKFDDINRNNFLSLEYCRLLRLLVP